LIINKVLTKYMWALTVAKNKHKIYVNEIKEQGVMSDMENTIY